MITPFEYEEIVAGKFAPFTAKKNGKWGYIDTVGKVIYPFELKMGQQFSMLKNNQWIDNKYIPCNPFPLSDSVKIQAPIYIGGNSFWLSADGKITERPSVDKSKLKIADNIFYVPNTKKGGALNMVNQDGKKILPYSLSTTFKESDGFIPFSIQRGKDGSIHRGKDGFYFPSIKKYFVYEKVQNKFHENAPIRWIKKNDKYGFIDKEAKEITPIHFERVGHTQEGMTSVIKDGKMGFIDKFGEMKIPMKFEDDRTYLPRFDNGVAYAFQNGKYGFINKKGETLAPFEFEAIAHFYEGVAIAYRNGKWEELIF